MEGVIEEVLSGYFSPIAVAHQKEALSRSELIVGQIRNEKVLYTGDVLVSKHTNKLS